MPEPLTGSDAEKAEKALEYIKGQNLLFNGHGKVLCSAQALVNGVASALISERQRVWEKALEAVPTYCKVTINDPGETTKIPIDSVTRSALLKAMEDDMK